MMDGRKIHVPTQKPVFENRYDAGRQLAEKLIEFKNQPVIILAIPNGGLPIAVPVALELNAELDVVISQQITYSTFARRRVWRLLQMDG